MENLLPKMIVGSNVLKDVDQALKTEWLVTNGLGGYASSTVLGINARKYHGLLVAAFNPPVDRRVLLAKLDEEVKLGDQTYFLGANESTRGIQPEDHLLPTNFSLAPFPTYTYSIGTQFQLNKTIFMVNRKNVSIVVYEVVNASGNKAIVSIAPLANSRHFHAVTQKDQIPWTFVQKASTQGVMIRPSNGLSALMLFSTDGRYLAGQGEWVETYYRAEAQRGESSLDYCFKPGIFEHEIDPNETRRFSIVTIGGKTENEAPSVFYYIKGDSESVKQLFDAELKRRGDLIENFQKVHKGGQLEEWLKWLVLATDTFVVNRASTASLSVIAGYHWFADWGRDSLISLPGLALAVGQIEYAKKILLTFAHYCREGLVPNSFSENAQGKPAYNTVDATLWYVNAVLQFLKYTNDFQFVQETLWTTLESVIDHHVQGTLFNIHVDNDGLIAHGPQLTWMDAAPDGTPITPRNGKAVEIQALWYNTLKIMRLLAKRFGSEQKASTYNLMAEKAKMSFLEKFWDPRRNCLFDLVNDIHRDNSVRPNQILAVSLDFTMLEKARAQLVLETVWKQLVTPRGLRTLSSSNTRYIGRYKGDRWQRDKAYHNGTVWPWLLGPFATAFLKLKKHEDKWRIFAFENFLKPLFTEELYSHGLGQTSEIFDGDAPHEANGCIAQAWSVAEPLRAYLEDILLKRPPFEKKVLESKTA